MKLVLIMLVGILLLLVVRIFQLLVTTHCCIPLATLLKGGTSNTGS
jgi:hypothetical protein